MSENKKIDLLKGNPTKEPFPVSCIQVFCRFFEKVFKKLNNSEKK